MKLTNDKKILTVGLGLIGGSYAEALTKKGFAVTAIDSRRDAIDYALKKGIIELVIRATAMHNEVSVLDYISRLRGVQDKVSDKILIVPRIYTNKPRTTGAGYKGMLHYPDPGDKPNLIKGVIAIRRLHMKALTEYGFSCADEMLYPENHRYLNDLLSYVAVAMVRVIGLILRE